MPSKQKKRTLKKKNKRAFEKEKASKSFKKSCKYKTRFHKTTAKNNQDQNKDKHSKLKQEVVVQFFEMLLTIKLFHWRTHSFATHKATDELYEQLNGHMDKIVEVMIGKHDKRIDLPKPKTIQLHDLNHSSILKRYINDFIKYLLKLDKYHLGPDLYNIRDDIITDLTQFLYLLSFL